jgi:hypothetical protein
MGTLSAMARALWRWLAALLRWIGNFGRTPPLVTVEKSEIVKVQGRPFDLQILRSYVDGTHYRVLQISGDGIVISFHAAEPKPGLSVSGPTIRYGSHAFEVLPQANRYRVDGIDHQLDAPGVYALSGSRLLGRIL